jgi:hypothetical protein
MLRLDFCSGETRPASNQPRALASAPPVWLWLGCYFLPGRAARCGEPGAPQS